MKRLCPDGHWSELAVPDAALWQSEYMAGLRVDSTGALYVADTFPPRIQKRDPNGTWTIVCAASTEPGIFCDIRCFAVDSHGSLYVVDYLLQQVQKRDPQGRWTVVVDVANQLGESHYLNSIAVDRQDNLYMVDSKDWRTSRVMTRDSHGEWELCMPPGTAAGQSQRPMYVSVDASDNLYVIDRPIDPNGISPGGRLQRRDPKGHWTVLVEVETEPDQQLGLEGLGAVAAAPDGNIYVADHVNEGQARLWMLDSRGRWTTVAAFGPALGQVSTVSALATDSFGRLYVSEYGNKRVQVRDVNGKWYELSTAGSAGLSESSSALRNVAVDRHGVVYVTANSRVFRWTPQPLSKAAVGASGDKK
jgi:sugar lactone lactonase YvrE